MLGDWDHCLGSEPLMRQIRFYLEKIEEKKKADQIRLEANFMSPDEFINRIHMKNKERRVKRAEDEYSSSGDICGSNRSQDSADTDNNDNSEAMMDVDEDVTLTELLKLKRSEHLR